MESHTLDPKSRNEFMLVGLTEFLGMATYLLVLNVTKGDPLALGLTVFIVTCIGDKISGAHLNPVVTLGVYFHEAKFANQWSKMLTMIICQILGAYFGLMVFTFIYH